MNTKYLSRFVQVLGDNLCIRELLGKYFLLVCLNLRIHMWPL